MSGPMEGLEHSPDRDRQIRKTRPSFGPADLTENEIAWIEFLRLVSDSRDPRPTFRKVHLLRRILRRWI